MKRRNNPLIESILIFSLLVGGAALIVADTGWYTFTGIWLLMWANNIGLKYEV